MATGYLKLLHLLAVVIFLGNIFSGLFWMHLAFNTKDIKILSHTIKGVRRSDILFTIPGALLLFIFGFLASSKGQLPMFDTGWILGSIVLFLLVGIIFSSQIVPAQRNLDIILNGMISGEATDFGEIKKIYLKWRMLVLISIAVTTFAFILMTLKIPT